MNRPERCFSGSYRVPFPQWQTGEKALHLVMRQPATAPPSKPYDLDLVVDRVSLPSEEDSAPRIGIPWLTGLGDNNGVLCLCSCVV